MLLKKLWNDEVGALVSLETVMVATMGTLAVTGGIASLASSVNSELGDLSAAVLSFDQSFSTSGYTINGSVQGGASSGSGSGSTASGTRFSAFKAPSGFQQRGSGGVNFGGAASQGFQQQSISMPNLSATIEVEEIAGDTETDLDSFTTNLPNIRVEPRSSLRNQAQSSRQSDRLREKVVIEEGIDAEDGSDFELQTIVVPRNRRNNRANPY